MRPPPNIVQLSCSYCCRSRGCHFLAATAGPVVTAVILQLLLVQSVLLLSRSYCWCSRCCCVLQLLLLQSVLPLSSSYCWCSRCCCCLAATAGAVGAAVSCSYCCRSRGCRFLATTAGAVVVAVILLFLIVFVSFFSLLHSIPQERCFTTARHENSTVTRAL